jgi:hypothetical protein
MGNYFVLFKRLRAGEMKGNSKKLRTASKPVDFIKGYHQAKFCNVTATETFLVV